MAEQKINIHKVGREDQESIVEFQLKMAMETENLQLDQATVSAGVNHILTHPEKGFYLKALAGEEMIASVLVLFEWSDWRNGEVLWIHSLYVVPEYRRKGVFRMFYDYLQVEVNAKPEFKGLRLYVEKTNSNAQKAYQAVGMTKEHYELFEWLKDY